jgi:hypothetical protein
MYTQLKGLRGNNTPYILSVIITLLMLLASLGGLFLHYLYQDSDFIQVAWRSNDMVTLLVAVPLMILSMVFAKRGSDRWLLVWMGMLLYTLYNYSFYLFGAIFNKFFLVYASLVALSIYTLILSLSHLDVKSIAARFNAKTPVKAVSLYLVAVTLPLLYVEVSQCINFLISEKQPEAPPLIFALDFIFVIPATVLAAVHIWNRHPWGYILAVLMLVKGFVYGLVLSIGTGILAYASVFGKMDSLMPFYIVVAIGGLAGCWLLLRNLNDHPEN